MRAVRTVIVMCGTPSVPKCLRTGQNCVGRPSQGHTRKARLPWQLGLALWQGPRQGRKPGERRRDAGSHSNGRGKVRRSKTSFVLFGKP